MADNKLIASDVASIEHADDSSVVFLSQEKMEELHLYRGDAVLLKGKNDKEAVCIVLSGEQCMVHKVYLNNVVRQNLGVNFDDEVSVSFIDVQYGQAIHVLPFSDTLEGFNGDLFDGFLKPFFLNAYRPVTKGNTFLVHEGMKTVEFKVMETNPSPYCIVAPETMIYCDGDPLIRQDNGGEVDMSNLVG
ncbi:transitional endoplasmic reticulum ATPase-like [Dysidea avara]|uniref:transitional endoplasmic reticulum ATPase-like n=1 Tax=Dysidea avara TaxID=196820 RepID=UPI003332B0EC